MSNLPSHPDDGDDNRAGTGHGSSASTPRWVSALGIIIGILLILLFVGLHLSGAVGPGAH